MNKTTGNQSVYPIGDTDNIYEGQAGITKREYFAAMAMQGMLTSDDGGFDPNHKTKIATNAVEQADALIAALSKTGKT